MKVVAVDGDQVGKRLEQAIFNSDPDTLANLSSSITSYFQEISKFLSMNNLRVLVHGGDIVIALGDVTPAIVNGLFELPGPVSISAGIGSSILTAHLALRMAKASGGSRSIEAIGFIHGSLKFSNYLDAIQLSNVSSNVAGQHQHAADGAAPRS